MPHRYDCPLRWADLNAAGHVDHCVVVDYLQEARVELLTSQPAPLGVMLDEGVLVTAHHVEYLEQVFAGPVPLRIDLWVDQVGGARFSISYRLSDVSGPEPRLVARARTFLVSYDLRAGAMRRLTAEERQQLTAMAEPPVELSPLPRPGVLPADAHRASARTRWSEMDVYGHVNNVKFFDYVSEARNLLLAAVTGLDPAAPGTPEVGWVVARQDLDYLLPIDFRRAPYEVRTAVEQVGRSSARLAAEIVDPDDGRRFARAVSVVVRVDPGTGRSTPWTDDERTALGR
ncbi:acyl-CoA thioester hydrolase [Friedmanniella endophytica]|uniref:Acyl-CoA thioester hydrolase n=1 Tax=Microlunatus kandeliicorticis TaxID=1759536 RepID=A0A7W3IVR9_9ACTN|nr:thioesterase family protein [Microlunatus kandeliicorticis]MBA8796104.1 acyl-CoA thioester hydrolase [Microlunatus kandeliicorticis]